MSNQSSWLQFLGPVAAAAVAAVLTALSWVARRHVKRIDDLEETAKAVATKSDLAAHREAIDADLAEVRRDQTERNSRLESKVDDMHRDITARIDRLLLAIRGGTP